MPIITIDEQQLEVETGTTILEAARVAGIEIPTLCHLPGRPAQASCFVCMVQIQGMKRLVPACGTAVTDGMVVSSETPDVLDARRTAIELLLSDHLGDCIGPCQGVCPAHMDIPRMIRHIAAGEDREALVTVKEAIALPAVLGRICPQLCEKGCRRAAKDGAVAVCRLKRYAADTDLESVEPYMAECAPATGKRIAIVGTGPAGLSAAYYLLQMGHACVLFDDHEKPGGNLRYAVPEELLPRDVLDAEIAIIERLGAEFRCGVRVGRDVPMERLEEDFDAVLLAVGEVKPEAAPAPDLTFGPQGIRADKSSMQTNLEGVFAAGAAIIASRHAVRACGDGRAAAQAIGRYLSSGDAVRDEKEFSCHVGKLDEPAVTPYVKTASPEPRLSPHTGPLGGFDPDEARREAERCLNCDCRAAHDCKLRLFAQRLDANPIRFRADRREFILDQSHPEILFEPGKCIACGICVRIAADAGEELGLAYDGRGFPVRITAPLHASLRDGLRIAARACAEACPTGALVLRTDLA